MGHRPITLLDSVRRLLLLAHPLSPSLCFFRCMYHPPSVRPSVPTLESLWDREGEAGVQPLFIVPSNASSQRYLPAVSFRKEKLKVSAPCRSRGIRWRALIRRIALMYGDAAAISVPRLQTLTSGIFSCSLQLIVCEWIQKPLFVGVCHRQKASPPHRCRRPRRLSMSSACMRRGVKSSLNTRYRTPTAARQPSSQPARRSAALPCPALPCHAGQAGESASSEQGREGTTRKGCKLDKARFLHQCALCAFSRSGQGH